MPPKPISQKKWNKGLVPAPGILSQAPGTLQRVSNLLLTQRGSLQTCDGSFTLGTMALFPLPLALGVFNDYSTASYPFYPSLSSNSVNTMTLFIGYPSTPPSKLTYTRAIAATYTIPTLQAALLAPGDPQFGTSPSTITSYNPSSTTGTVAATVTAPAPSASNSLVFSGFPSVPLVPGETVTLYVTYSGSLVETGGVAHGSGSAAYSTNSGSTYTNFDNQPSSVFGPVTVQIVVPGGLTNLNQLFAQITATVTRGTATTGTETIVITDCHATVSASSTLSPYGGVSGQACLIPQILQFAATTILILGNGLPPQTVDVTVGAGATPANLANTFTASYPAWQASVAWVVGNQISVVVGGTAYLYTATQGGLSGSTMPTFPSAQGATVVDNQVIWQNVGAVTTSPAPRGAAHGIVYAGSLWLANTSPQTTSDQNDGPTVLKMSDTNNPQSWNPLNVAFIGRDDGTQITGLASFTIAEAGIAPTGSLCVFKEFSTYQVFGVFGATDFSIDQAQTDLGCIGPRSIQFLPGFGIARLTHLGFAIFDGVRDQLISEEIRPYIFGGIIQQADITPIDFSFVYFSKGTQATTPPLYFCLCPLLGANGSMSRVFCYDLVLKAWVIIDLPFPISALVSVRTGEGKPVLLGGRSDNGSVVRLQSGDPQWNSSTSGALPINWSAQLNDIFLEGGSQRAFFRQLTIRGQVLDPTIPPTIAVSITMDGQLINPTPIPYFIEPLPNSNQFQLDVDILLNGQVTHVALTGTGRLLIDSIDWDASPKQGRKVIG